MLFVAIGGEGSRNAYSIWN